MRNGLASDSKRRRGSRNVNLGVEYGIEKPSNKLFALTDLDSNTMGQSRKLKL